MIDFKSVRGLLIKEETRIPHLWSPSPFSPFQESILRNHPGSCYVCICHVRFFVTPWTVACQVPLSMDFSRQEYWSGLPFPSPEDLPNPGIEPRVPCIASRFFTIGYTCLCIKIVFSAPVTKYMWFWTWHIIEFKAWDLSVREVLQSTLLYYQNMHKVLTLVLHIE